MTDPAAFLARDRDLIIECAGPAALARHGAAALRCADVWTSSAAALADSVLADALAAAGQGSGHRLRVLAGAIAGLDGIATIATDPAATLQLSIDLPPASVSLSASVSASASASASACGDETVVDSGSVRAVALRHPDLVNVAVAAALAGPGLDRSRLQLLRPPPGRHRLRVDAQGRTGRMRLDLDLSPVMPGRHPVAMAIIAAMRQAVEPVYAG